jgi:hypothetical protein
MKTIKLISIITLLFCIAIISSCVKGKWDSIPDASNVDPGIATNFDLYSLKKKLGNLASYKITDEYVIAATVVANDKGGNFYKSIVVQDDSSGLPILIEKNGLYNDFPVGRKIYIKCKGLILSSYGKFVQMGYAIDNTGSLAGIPSALLNNYIVKANYPNPYTIRTVQISDISTINANNDRWLGTLIKIDSASFVGPDAGVPYAQDPTVASGTDRKIEDCAGASVIMRNSGYANFAKFITPLGRGNVTSIFSRYNSAAQLLIRDTMDVNMTGPKCGSNNVLFTIADVRSRIGTADTITPIGQKISGIVIVDKDYANSDSRNLVIQDATGGIVLRLPTPGHTYALGDKLEIDISGAKLAPFPTTMPNTLQLNLASLGKMSKVGTGTITPEVVTIAQLNSNITAYESELVKIANVTFPTGNFYSGTFTFKTNTINDGTGNALSYVRSVCTFGGDPMPVGPKTITCIAGQFNGATQVVLRRPSDIE